MIKKNLDDRSCENRVVWVIKFVIIGGGGGGFGGVYMCRGGWAGGGGFVMIK